MLGVLDEVADDGAVSVWVTVGGSVVVMVLAVLFPVDCVLWPSFFWAARLPTTPPTTAATTMTTTASPARIHIHRFIIFFTGVVGVDGAAGGRTQLACPWASG